MMKTFIQMLYLIHIIACFYYWISTHEGLKSNEFVYDGRGNAYIRCFYFATKTATSIGKNPKPTNNMERCFMTCCWMTGVFFFSILVGKIVPPSKLTLQADCALAFTARFNILSYLISCTTMTL